jgi:hypothetical protein
MSTSIPEADITLRDGRVVHLRAIRASDEAELLQAFDRMSEAARFMRFMRVSRAQCRTTAQGARFSGERIGLWLLSAGRR